MPMASAQRVSCSSLPTALSYTNMENNGSANTNALTSKLAKTRSTKWRRLARRNSKMALRMRR